MNETRRQSAFLRSLLYGKEETRYKRTRRFLSGYGADFMLKRETDPVLYMLARILLGILLFGMALAGGQAGLSPVFFTGGYMLIPAVLRLSNKSDNKMILTDLKAVYNTLAIKTEAGVFFTDSLAECRHVVKNPRLKAAFMELNTEIIVKNDIARSILAFNNKFHNQYIDSFCIFMEQALESGQTLQALSDMADQLDDIQKAIHAAEKEKQNMQVMKVELMIFAMVLAIIAYYVVYMMSAIAGELL